MTRKTILFLIQSGCLILFFNTNLIAQTTWYVGPNQSYTAPSALVDLVSDGDTILIEVDEYLRDTATWEQNNLVIEGLKSNGNIPVLDADSTAARDRAIWIFTGNNIKIRNIQFENCRSQMSENGAGILFEGQDLQVDSCVFLNNQRHIIVNSNIDSDIQVSHCEFAQNQSPPNRVNHLITVGKVKHFTLRFSYLHHADIGHYVASSAAKTDVLYNQIADEATGSSSYLLYFPIGGEAYVVGNVLMQGPETANKKMIAYGLAGLGFSQNAFNFYQNTIIKHFTKGPFLWMGQAVMETKIFNNLLIGNSPLMLGIEGMILSNQQVAFSAANFVNTNIYDYHLTANSPGLDEAIDYNKMQVRIPPNQEYVHPMGAKPRLTVDDLGAFELE